ncbi:MAG: alpha/beta fold hydrolase [Candidatus Binatia bacterium]
MSAPAPVQYVTAADGTVLAYAVHGAGVPCLYLNPLGWHLERCWDVEAHRRFFEWLSARAQLIRVDYRGSGLSQRGAVDCAMARIVEDLDRVLAHLGVGPVAVLAFGPSTLTALAFAHRFPTRIARLVLHHPVASGAELAAASGMSEIGPLIERNWELFTELSAAALFGTHDARASQQAALLRAAVTPAEFGALWQTLLATDVSALLPEITAPALVVLPSESLSMEPNAVRRVAAALPNARVIGMEGRFVARVLENPRMVAAIAEFLDLPAGPASGAASQRTAVILFADIVDSTALTERLGDAAFAGAPAPSTTTCAPASAPVAGTPSTASSWATACSPSSARRAPRSPSPSPAATRRPPPICRCTSACTPAT